MALDLWFILFLLGILSARNSDTKQCRGNAQKQRAAWSGTFFLVKLPILEKVESKSFPTKAGVDCLPWRQLAEVRDPECWLPRHSLAQHKPLAVSCFLLMHVIPPCFLLHLRMNSTGISFQWGYSFLCHSVATFSLFSLSVALKPLQD